MIKIEIESARLENKSGVSSRTQKNYSINEQQALLLREGERYPDKIKITLKDGEAAYPVGSYHLDDSSFFVGGFSTLEVRPVLVRIAVANAAPARATA
jgi:hypothetical protein